MLFSVSYDMCEEIAKIRRKLQRIGSAKVLLLDETHKREGDVDNYTIVLPGEPPYIETSATDSYASRYDMIACCSGYTVLPPIIYSPTEDVKEFHASLILCLMFLFVSGPEERTRCLQRLNRELSRGERRFADAVGMRMTSVNSWHPQSWNVSMILPSL